MTAVEAVAALMIWRLFKMARPTPPAPREAVSWVVWGTSFQDPAIASPGPHGDYTMRPGDVLAALPAKEALGTRIGVRSNERELHGLLVADLGPWNGRRREDGVYVEDPYWRLGRRPQAESGIDLSGRKTNGAGIDLSHEAWRQLGIANPENHSGWVEWWLEA